MKIGPLINYFFVCFPIAITFNEHGFAGSKDYHRNSTIAINRSKSNRFRLLLLRDISGRLLLHAGGRLMTRARLITSFAGLLRLVNLNKLGLSFSE